ncbi:MAG: hypothetical protein HDR32_06580 [Treponema sp.]|nr:hypothetical protein [Treponema sp.]
MKHRSFNKVRAFCVLIFGLVLISCDTVSDESETSAKGESSSGGTSKNYLSESVWTDGKFSKDGQIDTYRISVNKGVRYFIYMNNAYDGDRTKTAQSGLKITHGDGTIICSSYNNAKNLYSKPYTFSASSTGTITITVASYKDGYYGGWEQNTGTYAIKYTSRPECDKLFEGVWQDDIIIAEGQTNKYSINVINETRYFIYMNNAYDGDGIKTAQSGLKITHGDGTIICGSYGSAESLYAKPYTFTVSSTGTITITVASYKDGYYGGWEQNTGTYAIKYTSRPEYIALSEGVWQDDIIIAEGQTNKYSINVTAGRQYSIYLNNVYEGDGTKTAQTGLRILYGQNSHSDNPIICNNYSNAKSLYSKPYTFTAPSTGSITITAASYKDGYYGGWEQNTGTYAIKYTKNN